MVECGVLISRHRLYKCFQCLGRHPKSFQKLYNVCIGPTYRNCLRDIANNQSYAQAESFLMFPILQAECSATWSVYISVPYSCATHHSPLAALPHPNKNAKSWCKRQQVYYSMTCLMFWDSFSKGIKQHIYHTYIIHILYISYRIVKNCWFQHVANLVSNLTTLNLSWVEAHKPEVGLRTPFVNQFLFSKPTVAYKIMFAIYQTSITLVWPPPSNSDNSDHHDYYMFSGGSLLDFICIVTGRGQHQKYQLKKEGLTICCILPFSFRAIFLPSHAASGPVWSLEFWPTVSWKCTQPEVLEPSSAAWCFTTLAKSCSCCISMSTLAE